MLWRACALLIFALTATHASGAEGAPDHALQDRVDALAQQVEIRFKHYPPAWAAKREALQTVLAAWNESTPPGSEASPANRELMERWLSVALRRVMPGGSGQLPKAPRFEAAPVPRAEPTRPPAVAEPVEARRVPSIVREQRTPTLAIEAIQPIAPTPARERFTRPRPTRAQTTPATRSRSQFLGPRLTQQRPLPDPAPRRRPATNEPATADPGPGYAAKRSPRSQPSRPRLAPAPSQAAEARDPFIDDQQASPNPLRAATRRDTRLPTFRAATATNVDLAQLAAEVRGYNAAVRDLQARVMRFDEVDVFGITDSADELERLEEKRQFLDLYRRGLTPAERGRLPESPSSELVRELIRRRAAELFRQTPPERQAERQALRRLNERLARFGRQASAKY